MSRLSIRMKILIVFMGLFTIALGILLYWFYQSATQRAMDNLRQNLMVTAGTAAGLIDAEEVMLVSEGEGEDGEAEYEHLASQLLLVQEANPKAAGLYIMERSPDAEEELLFILDLGDEFDEVVGWPYDASGQPEMLEAFNGPAASPILRTDEYGVWLSGFAPIRNAQGESIAIVGVDMEARDVTQVQQQILVASLLAFIVAYVGVFVAAILLSGAITRSLSKITGAAQSLEKGEPFEPSRLETVERELDELGQLARVFSKMAVEVEAREKKLKQEVAQLRIEIDEAKRAQEVKEIADTDYFRDLQKQAKEIRNKNKTK